MEADTTLVYPHVSDCSSASEAQGLWWLHAEGGHTMAYGTEFLTLLQNALEKEEANLRHLVDGCKERRLEPSLRSIRQFDESWIKYLLALEQMHSKQCPKLEFEADKIDVQFSSGGKYVAAFELKGPRPASPLSAGDLQKIIEDFSKQGRIVSADLEANMVLLLHGTESELKTCIDEVARTARKAAGISKIETSGDIRLNLGNGVLRVCVFKIGA
jgi:hypothetical protein